MNKSKTKALAFSKYGNKSSSKRIKGYDLARALAVFIMVFVNFEMVLAEKTTSGIYHSIFDSLHGKGAALFVVLAGAGMSLMLKSAIENGDKQLLWQKQFVLLKRAAFLFVFGLIYLPLWPADILHFYGFYISIGALMISSKSQRLWTIAISLIIIYPLILLGIDYETGWNWETIEYADFWTPNGFFRNLFINGFHPIIPWVSFVLVGIWLGRQDLYQRKGSRNILLLSVFTICLVQLVSHLCIDMVTAKQLLSHSDAQYLFGTSPMPPLPLYMISGIAFSYIVIILCIRFTEKFAHNKWIEILVVTGQMAFTHYVGHVVVGILTIYFLFGENGLSIAFTFWYACFSCLFSIVFSWFWQKRFKRGPMSMLMRLVTK